MVGSVPRLAPTQKDPTHWTKVSSVSFMDLYIPKPKWKHSISIRCKKKNLSFKSFILTNEQWCLLHFGTPSPCDCVSSQKLDFVNNSLLTVWSYFSFSDKERDKSDHLISAWFSWSLSSKEILTPQLQDDGAVSFACCWISLTMLHTQTLRELSVVLLSYLLSKCTLLYVTHKEFHTCVTSKGSEVFSTQLITSVIFASFGSLLSQARNQRSKAIIWCHHETKHGSAPLTMNQRLMESKNVCLTFLSIALDTESVQKVDLSFSTNREAPGFVSLMTTRVPCLCQFQLEWHVIMCTNPDFTV